jgi:hypothetical protein
VLEELPLVGPDQLTVPLPVPETKIEPSVALQEFGSSGVKEITGKETTVIVPVAFTEPQPPVSGIEKGKVPDIVGVPLTVMVFPNQEAVNPAGSPVATPIPVAPVVMKVIVGERAVFTQSAGLLDAVVTELIGLTVIVPVAFTVPQPPVRGIE